MPYITNVATKASLNADVSEVKGEMPNITNLATKTAINAKISEVKGEIPSNTVVENKIHNVSNLASKSDIAVVVKNTDFDNKLLGFNKRINSDKTEHVLYMYLLSTLTCT